MSCLENEAVLDRMQARLAKRPELFNQRRETVEHPFGSIKQWMNQGAFLMRGLEKVRGEFSLTSLAYKAGAQYGALQRVDGCGAGLNSHLRVTSPKAGERVCRALRRDSHEPRLGCGRDAHTQRL